MLPECQQTFTPEDFDGHNTEFCIEFEGLEYCGKFHVSCSKCIEVGDIDGCLELIGLNEDGTIAEKCEK